jgi:RNA polymerase sigma-70 factor (sigma-E family)
MVNVRQRRSSGESERDAEFHAFVAGRRGAILHLARLLTAGDAHLAEDLVQTALTKLYVSWTAYRKADNPEAYVRRTLVNALTDERKRLGRFGRPTAAIPDRSTPDGPPSDGDPALSEALLALPPRMRAAVIFRFVYELDVAQTAEALGCSAGTVKSQTARALDKLRASLQQPVTTIFPEPQRQGASR